MNFLLNPDQEEIQNLVEDFFKNQLHHSLKPSIEKFSELEELGFFAVNLPETSGGLGLGVTSLTVGFRACGYNLCPLPVQEHMLAGCVLENPEGIHTINTPFGIPCADSAKKIIDINEDSLKIYDTGSLKLEKTGCMDFSRNYFSGSLEKPESETKVTPEQKKLFHLGICSELTGLAKYAVDISVSWSKERKQFGKQIGSFQAIQHKLAEMSLAAEQALALERFTAWCFDKDKSQLEQSLGSLGWLCKNTLITVIESAIQVHGGIGFTEEHELHLYLRRATVLSRML